VKLGFSKSGIGDFEWFLFLTTGVSFFWSMGLLNAFKSYFPSKTEVEQQRLIFNLLIVFLAFGCISAGLLYWTRYGQEINAQANWLYFSLFLIFGISASITEHILIVKNRSHSLFWYGAISYSLYFLGLSILAFLYQSIHVLFIFLAVWALLRFAYTVYIIVEEGEWRLDIPLVSKFLLFSVPLIINILLGGGMEYVDGYLVNTYYSREDFTVFRYGARELPINTIFITAMVATMIPLAVTDISTTLSDMKARTRSLMNWLFPISALLIMISPLIFQAVYNDGYIDSAFIFNIYLLILCSRIVLPQVIIYAKQKNSVLMWIGLIELILNISLSLYLMEDFGLMGIAFATIIAYIVQKSIMILYCKYQLNFKMSDYLDVRLHFVYSLLLYVVFFVSYYIYAY